MHTHSPQRINLCNVCTLAVQGGNQAPSSPRAGRAEYDNMMNVAQHLAKQNEELAKAVRDTGHQLKHQQVGCAFHGQLCDSWQ